MDMQHHTTRFATVVYSYCNITQLLQHHCCSDLLLLEVLGQKGAVFGRVQFPVRVNIPTAAMDCAGIQETDCVL